MPRTGPSVAARPAALFAALFAALVGVAGCGVLNDHGWVFPTPPEPGPGDRRA
jgi:hypothetical protein